MKILLIDDDALQLQVREAVLCGAGFEVRTAGTAEAALAELGSHSAGDFDLIITDHILPGASGAVFVRQLRAIEPHIPVMVISGMAGAADEYEGLDVHFRQKPYPALQLIALAQELASHKQRSS